MLGTRIAALRRAAGWSQGDLAQQLGVSASAVGMYEQGRREPSADLLVALARTFGVSVDYLLTGTPNPADREIAEQAMETALESAEKQLSLRKNRPLSRQEMAVLFAALLMEG